MGLLVGLLGCYSINTIDMLGKAALLNGEKLYTQRKLQKSNAKKALNCTSILTLAEFKSQTRQIV